MSKNISLERLGGIIINVFSKISADWLLVINLLAPGFYLNNLFTLIFILARFFIWYLTSKINIKVHTCVALAATFLGALYLASPIPFFDFIQRTSIVWTMILLISVFTVNHKDLSFNIIFYTIGTLIALYALDITPYRLGFIILIPFFVGALLNSSSIGLKKLVVGIILLIYSFAYPSGFGWCCLFFYFSTLIFPARNIVLWSAISLLLFPFILLLIQSITNVYQSLILFDPVLLFGSALVDDNFYTRLFMWFDVVENAKLLPSTAPLVDGLFSQNIELVFKPEGDVNLLTLRPHNLAVSMLGTFGWLVYGIAACVVGWAFRFWVLQNFGKNDYLVFITLCFVMVALSLNVSFASAYYAPMFILIFLKIGSLKNACHNRP